MNNRGIYLIIYNGPGQPDDRNNPDWLTLNTGCCKFGQSLDLNGVFNRYRRLLNGNCEIIIAGKFKDRDDIDAIEKSLHNKFSDRRLININNRKSEWMEPISRNELSSAFIEVIKEHYLINI